MEWLILMKKLLTNIFKNIIRQLFDGESHQVVKITELYYGGAQVVADSPQEAKKSWLKNCCTVFLHRETEGKRGDRRLGCTPREYHKEAKVTSYLYFGGEGYR